MVLLATDPAEPRRVYVSPFEVSPAAGSTRERTTRPPDAVEASIDTTDRPTSATTAQHAHVNACTIRRRSDGAA
jgi:hypothetical protein